MSTLQGKRVVVVGGGSGGHIMPVAAVVEQLKTQGAVLLWLGDDAVHGLAKKTATSLGVDFEQIPAGKIRRYFSLNNLKTPFELLAGVAKAAKLLKRFDPDVVFTKGGHVSLPVVLAARRAKIPIVIHESDAVMGLANRIAARFVDRVCVTVTQTAGVPAQVATVLTGVPIRREFFLRERPRANKRRPVLLVSAGSQGSEGINQVIRTALPELTKFLEVRHVTGPSHVAAFAHLRSAYYQPVGFVDDMAHQLRSADIVLARSSATILAELAILGKPGILIPLPRAANDHAGANAKIWEEHGAAIVIQQAQLSSGRLVETLQKLLEEPRRLETMSRAAASLAVPDAAERIIDVIASTL